MTKDEREVVAYVVREGKRRGKGLYFQDGSDETGVTVTTNADAAYRWVVGPWLRERTRELAAAVARRWNGRVVAITVAGRLRQVKPRRVPRRRR